MKKFLILMAAFAFVVRFANAQTEKGAQTLGLNFGLYDMDIKMVSSQGATNDANPDNKYTSFNIGPQYSYFFADNADIGATLSYRSATQKNNNYTGSSLFAQSGENIGASAYIRKYFLISNKIGFRAGPYLSYYMAWSRDNYLLNNTSTLDKGTAKELDAGVNLDLVYYASKHLGLSANIINLDFTHQLDNFGSSGSTTTNTVNFKFISNAVQLYVFYVFGGK